MTPPSVMVRQRWWKEALLWKEEGGGGGGGGTDVFVIGEFERKTLRVSRRKRAARASETERDDWPSG